MSLLVFIARSHLHRHLCSLAADFNTIRIERRQQAVRTPRKWVTSRGGGRILPPRRRRPLRRFGGLVFIVTGPMHPPAFLHPESGTCRSLVLSIFFVFFFGRIHTYPETKGGGGILKGTGQGTGNRENAVFPKCSRNMFRNHFGKTLEYSMRPKRDHPRRLEYCLFLVL